MTDQPAKNKDIIPPSPSEELVERVAKILIEKSKGGEPGDLERELIEVAQRELLEEIERLRDTVEKDGETIARWVRSSQTFQARVAAVEKARDAAIKERDSMRSQWEAMDQDCAEAERQRDDYIERLGDVNVRRQENEVRAILAESQRDELLQLIKEAGVE